MDAGAAKYLEENVGGILAKALAEMAKVQPKDRPKGSTLPRRVKVLRWVMTSVGSL